MNSGNRTGDAWPQPGVRVARSLPRLEEIRRRTDGYDPDAVGAAFDSFYRHIAQLDSTLRTLQAVEVFRDQAGELRRELRALKAAGWAWNGRTDVVESHAAPGVPEWLPRVAVEATFLILVATVVAVSGFSRVSIVLIMALAWTVVGVVEWAASSERFTPTALVERVLARDSLTDTCRASSPAVALPDPVGRSTARPIPSDPEQAHTLVRREPGHSAGLPPPGEAAGGGEPDFAATSPALANVATESTGETTVRPPTTDREADRRPNAIQRRIALVALVGLALPTGLTPASLPFPGRDVKPVAAAPQVVSASPRSQARAETGPPSRESARPRTTAVVLASRGDSWLEIRPNAQHGKKLYSGVLVHGRSLRVESERLWVRFGAASNVELRVNGRRVPTLFGTVAVLLTPDGRAETR